LTENHPGFFNSEGGDQGGPFHSRKTEVEQTGSKGRVGTSYYGYEGEFGIYGLYAQGGNTWESSPVTATSSSNDRLFALGGTAISRSVPTNPVGGAATFLGELRQGVPNVIGSTLFRDRAKELMKAQKAGHEYLNLEFGWKPLVADVRKFALGVKKHDQIVSQLSRDSGKNVRRGYKFPAEDDGGTTFDAQQQFVLGTPEGGGLNTYIYGPPGHYVQTYASSERKWFSGCYTYHLPDYNELFGVKRYLAEADKVLGTNITPEVLWNLAPWSWAADWFANTGDVLNNLTQFSQNDFAMRYGYIMETKTSSIVCQGSQQLNTFSGALESHYAYRKFTATSMVRVPASPFGFGITSADFSPRQLAISAALGINRVR